MSNVETVTSLNNGPHIEAPGLIEDPEKARAMAEASQRHMSEALRAKTNGKVLVDSVAGQEAFMERSVAAGYTGPDVHKELLQSGVEEAAQVERVERGLAVGQAHFAGERYDAEHDSDH